MMELLLHRSIGLLAVSLLVVGCATGEDPSIDSVSSANADASSGADSGGSDGRLNNEASKVDGGDRGDGSVLEDGGNADGSATADTAKDQEAADAQQQMDGSDGAIQPGDSEPGDSQTDGGSPADAAGGDGAKSDATGLDSAIPSDGSATDGSQDSGASDLPVCTDPVTVIGPLATAVDFDLYGTYDPGPLMLVDERAMVFLEGTGMWMTASHGSGYTANVPPSLANGTQFRSFRSLSGRVAVGFMRDSKFWAALFDGSGFGPAVEVPCTYITSCTVRAAGDGHLWVASGGNFFEQVGNGFENRGGGPAGLGHWDVDSQGNVIATEGGYSTDEELMKFWKLTPGAAGWTKAGVLNQSVVAAAAATIEGGLELGVGALAPDGSIHLFSSAQCIGKGERNKARIYVRSRDGINWEVITLPSADILTGGLVTWSSPASWAGDYERVQYVTVASSPPVFDGWDWVYPDRRYDVIARCKDASGQATFARIASVELNGWTERGFTGFSESGTATLLTRAGLTQVY